MVGIISYFVMGQKIQVGDGDSDHYCWERAKDMSTPRSAYKIDSNHPGSDLAGKTAAAMAAASIAFKPYDSTYSQLLLLHAKQVSVPINKVLKIFYY